MGRAKEIIVKVIPAKIANEFVKQHHYSGKVVPNSNLHFGAFLDDKLHGVASFGNSMSKDKVVNLVDVNLPKHKAWNTFLELNRMAFDEYLPKNSESRVLSICFKLIQKNAPHIKWILSFSDGTASGDGTIYRATGFVLTQINVNKSILILPDGERVASLPITNRGDQSTMARVCAKLGIPTYSGATVKPILDAGAKWAEGFQLRYIYLIDKTCKITVPILPFSKIDEIGAGMYKGQKITLQERRANLSGEVGSNSNSKLDV
jgi:hypothetical protein